MSKNRAPWKKKFKGEATARMKPCFFCRRPIVKGEIFQQDTYWVSTEQLRDWYAKGILPELDPGLKAGQKIPIYAQVHDDCAPARRENRERASAALFGEHLQCAAAHYNERIIMTTETETTTEERAPRQRGSTPEYRQGLASKLLEFTLKGQKTNLNALKAGKDLTAANWEKLNATITETAAAARAEGDTTTASALSALNRQVRKEKRRAAKAEG